MNIYILPTTPGVPFKALLFEGDLSEPTPAIVAQWSSDVGAWTIAGEVVPTELSDTITEHAKSLGIEW